MDAEEIKALVVKLRQEAAEFYGYETAEQMLDSSYAEAWLSVDTKWQAAAALTAALADREDAEVDRAELRYWRNCNADIMRRKDRVDSLSHADRIADIRGAARRSHG